MYCIRDPPWGSWWRSWQSSATASQEVLPERPCWWSTDGTSGPTGRRLTSSLTAAFPRSSAGEGSCEHCEAAPTDPEHQQTSVSTLTTTSFQQTALGSCDLCETASPNLKSHYSFHTLTTALLPTTLNSHELCEKVSANPESHDNFHALTTTLLPTDRPQQSWTLVFVEQHLLTLIHMTFNFAHTEHNTATNRQP